MSKLRSKYFSEYETVTNTETEIERELKSAGTGPTDYGMDILPFEYIGGRRFEIMTYLLKSEEGGKSENLFITLVQSSADRGRDVIIYENSHLVGIIQCKNQVAKLTLPDLVCELLKVALHHHLDQTIIGDGPVVYEIWCSSDFTEPAAQLIDSWPTAWNQLDVSTAFRFVQKEYALFKKLTFKSLKLYLLNEFPKLIKIRKKNGIDISRMVRANTQIYERFFQANLVMKKDDVEESVKKFLSQGGLRQVSEPDIKHILDRIERIPSEKRLYLGIAHSMGISPKTLSLLSPAEETKFIVNCGTAVHHNITMILDALLRYIGKTSKAKIEGMKFNSTAFTYVLHGVLRKRVIASIGRVSVPISLRAQLLPESNSASLDTLISLLCSEAWDDLSVARREYDPTIHGPGSSEFEMARFAERAILGSVERKAFEATLSHDFERNKILISKWDSELQELIPEEIIIIADSKIYLDDSSLMEWTLKATQALDNLRKKVSEEQTAVHSSG